MTDFTDEEMRAIILRSLNENAARMRKKLQRKQRKASNGSAAGHGEPRNRTAAVKAEPTRYQSGE